VGLFVEGGLGSQVEGGTGELWLIRGIRCAEGEENQLGEAVLPLNLVRDFVFLHMVTVGNWSLGTSQRPLGEIGTGRQVHR